MYWEDLEAGIGIEPIYMDLQSSAEPACPPAVLTPDVGKAGGNVKLISAGSDPIKPAIPLDKGAHAVAHIGGRTAACQAVQ